MLLVDAYLSGWQRSFDYQGRSNRPDFWWFYLANIIVAFLLVILAIANQQFLNLFSLYCVAQLVPMVPLIVRRLRDAGKDWPWIFLFLVPLIGGIWLIVLLAQPSFHGLPL